MKDKFSVRLYQPGDAEKINMKEIFIQEKSSIIRIEKLYKSSGTNIYTCLSGDMPIAIIGWTFFFPGVVDLWSLISDRVKEYPKSFYKFCISLMNFGHNNLKIYRYQMVIREGNQDLIRWCASLKMRCEGFMEKFGPDGSNYLLFARVY